MKKFKIFLSKTALICLQKLERQIAKRITEKLEYLEKSSNPFIYAKKLKDTSNGQYRFRIGNYRVFFDVNEQGELNILYILTVKHRKDSYR